MKTVSLGQQIQKVNLKGWLYLFEREEIKIAAQIMHYGHLTPTLLSVIVLDNSFNLLEEIIGTISS